MLHYDPETGNFTWIKPNAKGPVKPGDRAGTVSAYGYVVICIDREYCLGHVLAWLYMTGEHPTHEIDHKDTIRTNNAWANLRPATRTQNSANASLRSDNRTGYKGVFYYVRRGRRPKYIASIRLDGKSRHLGYFETAIEAHHVYAAAARQAWGEYARP